MRRSQPSVEGGTVNSGDLSLKMFTIGIPDLLRIRDIEFDLEEDRERCLHGLATPADERSDPSDVRVQRPTLWLHINKLSP